MSAFLTKSCQRMSRILRRRHLSTESVHCISVAWEKFVLTEELIITYSVCLVSSAGGLHELSARSWGLNLLPLRHITCNAAAMRALAAIIVAI